MSIPPYRTALRASMLDDKVHTDHGSENQKGSISAGIQVVRYVAYTEHGGVRRETESSDTGSKVVRQEPGEGLESL